MKKKNRAKLTIFDKFILTLTICAFVSLLISYLASVISPAHAWAFALLGLGYPFIFLLNCFFILYWLFRKAVVSLIPFFGILAGFNVLIATFGFHPQNLIQQKPATQNIRMMAYNVRGFTSPDPKKNAEVQKGILQLICDQQPDIITIEEFSENVATRNDIYTSLSKTFGSTYHYFQPYDYTQYDSTGIAIFTRYPIINHGTVSSEKDKQETQAIYADLNYKGRTIRVYCLHLASTHFDDKEHAYLNELAHHGKISLHEIKLIGGKLKAAFIKRSYQVALIKQHLRKCPFPYIIAGDFNDTPISYSVSQISSGLKNAFKEKGSGPGITYYGDFPNVQIDYIMTNQQFDIVNYQSIKKKLSDHYAITSDLKPIY